MVCAAGLVILTVGIICGFRGGRPGLNNYCEEISDAVLRLHVRADNDSREAQEVKLLVRDAVIDSLSDYEAQMYDKASACRAVTSHSDVLEASAKTVLKENHCDYDVDIKLEKSWFPRKSYGDVSLPPGFYDAVVVTLGGGEGKNWWCVLFPKLCFTAPEDGIVPETSKNELRETLSDEAYASITKPRFKIVEWFEKIW